MSGLYMMATISDRNQARRFLDFYREYGLSVTLLTYGRGTAASEILDAFGLEAAEKAVIFSVVTGEEWKRLKTGLERQIKIDIPGSGIAFIVPVSSIGGKKQFEFLTDGRGFVKGEESTLKDTKYELLVVIANQGYTELVMDAARAAHAPGGTVIHAKGTGAEKAEKFFGVSLAKEKEVIFMVTRKEGKNAIMTSIMEKAGLDTKATVFYPINMTRNQWLKTAYTKDGAGWYFNSVGQPCSADDADGKATVTLDKAAKTLNVELTEGGIVAGTVFTLNVGFAVNGPDYDDYVRFTFEVGVTDPTVSVVSVAFSSDNATVTLPVEDYKENIETVFDMSIEEFLAKAADNTDIKFCLADPSTEEWSDMGENYTANAPGYSG